MVSTQEKSSPAAPQPSQEKPQPGWANDLDRKAVDIARALAMDAVQAAGSGHPGTAMSLAPAAYLLFQEFLRHDPTDPEWLGRDRFVLRAGHSSLTLYIQLYLSGYGLTHRRSQAVAAVGQSHPGPPRARPHAGSGDHHRPARPGVGNAVGMAMAARRERGLLDPDAPTGQSVFDHAIYCIAGDGCMEEGVRPRRPRWPATSGWAT